MSNNLSNCGDDETPNCAPVPDLSFAFPSPIATYVPPEFCKPELNLSTDECADKEAQYMASMMSESINIAGGPVNVFPMLGVHNQGSTIDQPGYGYPISSGTPAGYNLQDAFNIDVAAWISIQTGPAVLSAPAFIGYDFGTKKAWEKEIAAKERYFKPEPVRQKISTLKIKQSADPTRRATQLRVEASDDGMNWKRIDVINVPGTSDLVTVGINSVAAYNKWRIVPIFFGGASLNSPWEVSQIQFLEQTQMSLDTIEDYILLENRNRSYCRTSLLLKCTYDLLDVQTELAKFGINIPQTYIFTCSFADMVRVLARPVIVGDIVELPGEIQYDSSLRPIRKWLEVTDTNWATEGYTLNWKPNLFRFYAQPIMPSVEHKDILGLPGQVNAGQSDNSLFTDGFLSNQQAHDSTEAIAQYSKDAVPLDGEDPQNLKSGMSLKRIKGSYDGRDIYVQDALPPDGKDFTVGDTLPLGNTIVDGHYHRQTYTNVNPSIRPKDRLLKWNAGLQRWNVIEIDTRSTPSSYKKSLNNALSYERIDLNKKI